MDNIGLHTIDESVFYDDFADVIISYSSLPKKIIDFCFYLYIERLETNSYQGRRLPIAEACERAGIKYAPNRYNNVIRSKWFKQLTATFENISSDLVCKTGGIHHEKN